MSELQALRKQVKKFVDAASEKELEMVYHLFDAAKKTDWWDEIVKEQKRSIDKGCKQLDNRGGIPHEEVMKKYAQLLKITWSPLAVETYESIIDYILHKFGEAAVTKFVAAIDERMLLISSRPKMFRPTSKRKHTYIVAINRRLTLTYRYQSGKKEIELGVFWALQGPKRKPH